LIKKCKMKKKILIIIGTIILIGLVSSFSYFLGQKQVKVTSNPLESKVMENWSATASGKVTEISGRSLTLNNEGDILTILISEEASFGRIVPTEENEKSLGPLTRKEIEFSEIKVGDQVKISCRLNPEGLLEGLIVTILQ